MKKLILTALAVVAIAFVGVTPAFATKPNPDHQVWVCKYVGQPGDFETLKPGKNPIIVDVAAADAYVGADFADGQTHSFVIDLATDENTGQGDTYTGDATCPTPSPTPSASPSVEPSATPSVEPSVSPTPTPSLSATPAPTPVVTGSPTSAPLPPTDTDEANAPSSGPGLVFYVGLALVGFVIGLLLGTTDRRR